MEAITAIDSSALIREDSAVQSLAHTDGVAWLDVELEILGRFENEHNGRAKVEFAEDLTLLHWDRLTAGSHVTIVVR